MSEKSEKSETQKARNTLSKFCNGIGIDMGFGGSAIVDSAITFDQDKPYCDPWEYHRQILRGDCKNLSFICDNALDYIYSSHLLEDFYYHELKDILIEWRRTLTDGGLLVINCPDQQKFLNHCARTGQGINEAHKEPDFSLHTFKRVLEQTGQWETIFEQEEVDIYSWYLVLKKVN